VSKTATRPVITNAPDPRENAMDFAHAKNACREAGLLGDTQVEAVIARHMAKLRVAVLELERGIKGK
jgi:hypothetical protein